MAEDFDAFKDGDGCPDPDNDNDGFPDYTDDCPATDWTAGPDGIADTGDEPLDELGVPIKTREDFDGIIDWDGCHDSPGDDWDGDGMSDETEVLVAGTNPIDMDTDDDGLCDGHHPPTCASEDLNNNGIVDAGETNPLSWDSDGDGLSDGLERGLTAPETADTNTSSPHWQADTDPDSTTDPLNPDTDGDGISDGSEDANRNGAVDQGETCASDPDTDGDGFWDKAAASSINPNTDPTEDNCPLVYNPTQTNTPLGPIDNGPVVTGDDITNPYEDRVGDACDDDADNDWLSAADEAIAGTNAYKRDTDGDRVLDGAEVLLGSNPNNPNSKPSCSGIVDNDKDCLPADVEALFGSSDDIKDTDGDGISDSVEVKGWGTSPTMRDTDGDACDDDKEIAEVNGDAVVNVLDYQQVVRRVFRIQDDDPNDGNPVPDWDMQVSPAFDVNKDGVMNALDASLVVLNSSLVEPGNECDCR